MFLLWFVSESLFCWCESAVVDLWTVLKYIWKQTFILCFRATVPATPIVSLCCLSGHGRGGMWRSLPQWRPSTSLMMTVSILLWGSTHLFSGSSRRGHDGSTPPTPTRKSAKSKWTWDTSGPLWGILNLCNQHKSSLLSEQCSSFWSEMKLI